MKKDKIYAFISVVFLMIFSIFYTNKSIDIIKHSDPIMKMLYKNSDKYYSKAKNATITKNTIIPGRTGSKVDYNKSYKKMKNYGNYNEALTVFKEIKPTVSIDNIYDKFVISGNKEKKSVSFIFKIENNTNVETLERINNILKNKNIKSTMFIDGLFLENNLDLIRTFSNSELEILNYNNSYQEMYFSSAISYLNNFTGKEAKYCYADYDNKEVIELCSKLKLHTILPTVKLGNYPYKEIKEKLENASIVLVPISTTTQIELNTIIDYIKSRGYTFNTLDELLSENLEK